MGDSLKIDSIESIYKALNERNDLKAKALLMLMLRNWLTKVSRFDPVSGHALHTGIIEFLDAVAKSVHDESSESEIKDRTYRIVSHTKDAVLAIMEHTRDKILREHAMLPIHAAREVDSNSVQWLSRQPGRTLREKLSGKPYMKAVRRRSCVDTSENRLLRAFLFRLEQILIVRLNVLSAATEETCEELLVSLQRWLRSEKASEIGAWGNLPPNNTLLQDKRYRKVWDGWLCLRALDDNIKNDYKRLEQDLLVVIYWNVISFLYMNGRFRTVQQPLAIDYDHFSIKTILSVNGFLFPEIAPERTFGRIKKIFEDKGFGFISSAGEELFFHKNNISKKLSFEKLEEGNNVTYDIGHNRQGKCAVNVNLMHKPQKVNATLNDNQLTVQCGNKTVTATIYQITVTQPGGKKEEIRLRTSSYSKAARTILSNTIEGLGNEERKPSEVSCLTGPTIIDLCSIRPILVVGTAIPGRSKLTDWK